MDTLSASLYFVVGILGVGYPILLQAISRLDDKYSSTLILDRFNEEFEKKGFICFLITSVVALGIWCCNFPVIWTTPFLRYYLEHSAVGLAFTSTVILVIFFFLLVRKIIRYYSPLAFIRYLINKHENRKDPDDYKYFEAISQIMVYAIRQQNMSIINSITEFLYTSLKKVRESHGEKPVIYPIAMYETINDIIEEIAPSILLKFNTLANYTAGGVLLIGEFSEFKLSEETYSRLWNNLRICLNFGKNDFILFYWQNADQHYSLNLDLANNSKARQSLYEGDGSIYKQSKDEKDRFLELNYALGGLLLYEDNISCIQRIFSYTHSLPPKYPLLPETMDEVLHWYLHFTDFNNRSIAQISYRYPFPRLEGQMASEGIRLSIQKYIGLLFLRQYSLTQYYANIDPTGLPGLPNEPGVIRVWIDNLPIFSKIIEELLENKSLLKDLELDFISPEWSQQNRKDYPLAYLGRVLHRLKQLLEFTLKYQELSPAKEKEFLTAVGEKLIPLFESLERINNKEGTAENANVWVIRGRSTLMDKGAFAEDQGISYVDAASTLPDLIVDTFKTMTFRAFSSIRTVSYLLKREEYAAGFHNLKLNSDKIVLIAFNLSKDVLAKESPYNTVNWEPFEIYYFWTGNEIRESSIFVLNKANLPTIHYEDVSPELITKYALQKINAEFSLYASILDLHKFPHAIPEAIASDPRQDPEKLALLSIDFDVQIDFKKQIPCVHLRVSSSYFDQSIPNDVSEVRKFEERP